MSKSIVIKPLVNDFGQPYGAEARDEASGELLATGKQLAMEGQTLVVEETQYSGSAEVYKGKLFFSPGGTLAKEQAIRGAKRWEIFRDWRW